MAGPLAPRRYVRRQRAGGFLLVTLASPETRNALAPELMGELDEAFAEAERDAGVRAVVLRGAGKVFCAGGSLAEFQRRLASTTVPGAPDPIAEGNRRSGEVMARIAACTKVVVVAVHGAAMGGGMGLVCLGDLVITTRHTTFALSETTLGVIPAQIAPYVLERIGPAQARRLALTGERIDGAEAARIGLVTFVVEDEGALLAKLVEVLGGIAACAPQACAATKQLFRECAAGSMSPARAGELFAAQMRRDAAEGVAARLEKRAPAWVEQVAPGWFSDEGPLE